MALIPRTFRPMPWPEDEVAARLGTEHPAYWGFRRLAGAPPEEADVVEFVGPGESDPRLFRYLAPRMLRSAIEVFEEGQSPAETGYSYEVVELALAPLGESPDALAAMWHKFGLFTADELRLCRDVMDLLGTVPLLQRTIDTAMDRFWHVIPPLLDLKGRRTTSDR